MKMEVYWGMCGKLLDEESRDEAAADVDADGDGGVAPWLLLVDPLRIYAGKTKQPCMSLLLVLGQGMSSFQLDARQVWSL